MARHTPDGAEDLSWIPATCPDGHRLVPGSFTLSWRPCRCPWAEGTGHHVAVCKQGCHPPRVPPGCGPEHAIAEGRIIL